MSRPETHEIREDALNIVLADLLRRSYELLVSEDVVTAAVEDMDAAIEVASETMMASPATPSRLRALLGIPDETSGRPPETEASRACRTASLTLINAMVFQ